jgi:uridine kinase
VEAGNLLPAADQSETLRQTRCIIRECWSLRAESRRIKRDYEERQARIEVLMAKYPDVERA